MKIRLDPERITDGFTRLAGGTPRAPWGVPVFRSFETWADPGQGVVLAETHVWARQDWTQVVDRCTRVSARRPRAAAGP